MAVTVKQLLEAANAAVPRVTPVQAKEMMEKETLSSSTCAIRRRSN